MPAEDRSLPPPEQAPHAIGAAPPRGVRPDLLLQPVANALDLIVGEVPDTDTENEPGRDPEQYKQPRADERERLTGEGGKAGRGKREDTVHECSLPPNASLRNTAYCVVSPRFTESNPAGSILQEPEP